MERKVFFSILISLLLLPNSSAFCEGNREKLLCASLLTIRPTADGDLKTFLVGSADNGITTADDVVEIEKSFLDPLTANASYKKYTETLAAAGFYPFHHRGKVVVDLGSGLSNFIDYLSANGVDSYGIDFIYHPYHIKLATEKYNLKITNDLLDWKSSSNHGVDDYKIDFRRRIAGSFTNLPLKDNSVHALVSHFSYIYLHGRLLMRAANEIIRVLKPGGNAYMIYDGYLGEENNLHDIGISYTRFGSEEKGFWWIVLHKG